MPRLPLPLLLLIGGCATEFSLYPVVEASLTPSVALDTTYNELGYADTEGSCFRVLGAGRGTGYVQRPDLALGTVWTRDSFCPEGVCAWGPSLEIYTGPGRIEDEHPVESFEGYTFFDGSDDSAALGEIFGQRLVPGSLAHLSSSRVYSGTVDYSQRDTQAWISLWRDTHDEELRKEAGLAWQVMLWEWDATFFGGASSLAVDDDDDVIQVGDDLYAPTGQTLKGFEVFVCVVDMWI